MSALTEFFLGSKRQVVQLELLEISHPSFSRTFYIVRNNRNGVTVVIETSVSQFFEYMPLKVTGSGARDDLDTGIQVSFGDLGEVIPKELERIERDDSAYINPQVKYRIYKSDDLTQPLIGPYAFEITALSNNNKGASFEAKAPGLNFSKTGELYRVDRFPMLRGFL